MELPIQDAAVYLAHALQVGVGVVFGVAALTKLRRTDTFSKTIADYHIVSASLAVFLAPALVAVETVLAFALVTGWGALPALHVAFLTAVSFAAAVGLNLSRGRRIDCGCFGSAHEQISIRSLARLLLLLAAVAVLLVASYFDVAAPGELTSLRGSAADKLAYLVELVALSCAWLLAAAWSLSARETFIALSKATKNTSPGHAGAQDLGA